MSYIKLLFLFISFIVLTFLPLLIGLVFILGDPVSYSNGLILLTVLFQITWWYLLYYFITKGVKNVVIDKEIFRSVVSEFTPTIAEDSQQPEWSQGELDKCYDELMLRNPIKLK